MNNNRILEMARLQIPDLASVGQDIYKGTLSIDDKIAGIYYFDLSNNIPDDFEGYQEQLLSDEFYDNPGSRQWNYYLFLLNDTLSDDKKRQIERNDRYARKFVLDENGFEDFFHFEEAEKEIRSSIVTQWKDALDSVDLQEVYGEDSYVEIFDRFCKNTTKKVKGMARKAALVPVEHITFINRVLLKDGYRKFPKELRDFHFGKVNLLQGINGVGKTSVFEAIELMLCGATFRNKQQLNANGCVEAEYNGAGSMTSYQAKNSGLYQSRDLSWYATTNTRGNTLFNSFNRFNYFNADAAQQFSSGGTEEEISDALFNIVLGPEYTYIQERSSKMMTRISPVFKKLEAEIDQMQNRISVADKVTLMYKRPDSLQLMFSIIGELISSINFKNGNFDFNQQSALVEQENNRLQVVLSYFAADNFGFDTLEYHQKQLAAFEKKKNSFTGLIENMKLLNLELGEQQKTSKRLEGNRGVISKARGYLQDGRFVELRGLDEKMRQISFQRQKKQFVKEGLGETALSALSSEIDIRAFIKELKSHVSVDEKEKERLNLHITDEIGKLGKVEGLVKEIKLAGAQYLDLHPAATNCPMCQSSFDRSLLELRIKSLAEIAIDINTVETNRKAVDKIVDQIAEKNALIQIAEKIHNIYHAYFEGAESVSVKQTVLLLKQVIASIADTDVELQRLRGVADFGKLSGKSEQELKSLDSSLEGILGMPMQIVLADLNRLNDINTELEKEISSQEGIRSTIMQKRYAIGLDIKNLLGYPAEDQIDVKFAEEVLKKEGDKLEAFLRYFNEITAIVVLKPSDSITILKGETDLLRENIASYREATKAEVEFNAAQKEKKESEQFIRDNRIKYERLKKAFDTLKTLSENEESGKQLEEFFDQNFTEIADIFRSIHLPREFSDLRYDGKKISLYDEDGGTRGVTEISTGQRSALALAIFLSLNKKLVDGPNLIMFDDPVAFIDDFNALSFLDYLRNYVLRSGRQIFFATANTRLANLFEKKFNFLGEGGFVRYELKR